MEDRLLPSNIFHNSKALTRVGCNQEGIRLPGFRAVDPRILPRCVFNGFGFVIVGNLIGLMEILHALEC